MTENLCRELAAALLADRGWATERDRAELAEALQTAGAQWLQMVDKLEAHRNHTEPSEEWYRTFKQGLGQSRPRPRVAW